ncbi:GDP-mannose 4,6-dehydratase [Alicyclobacillus sp. ALC3]|uniref:GDP-mannose 4,6-dehydratase n=1 Tax=Alicyclobacillus sp. ALC3 TaxID=2796143 RepID=UPI0023788912|nr:GDP-mannose 4,6-dehydratase [Alicyclobacillus sp. ALC3]WDL95149.1 GDP-mannose 4,6-dehydratase [Alicyclobacillus sp. ALC3]
MRALITGITGFTGSHLAEFLLKQGVEVYGTRRIRSPLEHIRGILGDIHLVECELRDAFSVHEMLHTVQPDYIFHLAAQSFVPTSWNSPTDTLTNNVISQVNLMESIRRLDKNVRMQIACSSEEYGLVLPEESPIQETNPLRPLSTYAVSKVAQDFLGYQYFRSYGLHIIRTRAFNHEGPRRGEVFVLSNFAKQIAEMEMQLREPVLHVGNLQAKRDFTDVRDVVRAYWFALEKGEPGEVYNIGTGLSWTIQECVDKLLKLTDLNVEVKVDPTRLRPSDVELLMAGFDKLSTRTGWRPTIPLEQTVQDTLDYWRHKLRAERTTGERPYD